MKADKKNASRKEKTSGNTIDLTMFIQNGNANDDGIEGKIEREREREKKIARRRNNSPTLIINMFIQ